MSNTFLTDDIITLEAIDILENNAVALQHTDRRFELLFGPHGGSNRSNTIKIRKPPQYTVRTGANYSAQDITDDSVSLVVDQQIGIDVELTSAELKQDLSSFSNQVLKPQISRLAQYVDNYILTQAHQTFNLVGTPGTVPSALSTYLAAGVKLDQGACPRDGQRAMIIGPQMQADIVDSLKGLLNDGGKVSGQYLDGEMTRAAGFRWAMDQNVATHTEGPRGGTPLVNAASQTGSSLITDGWTSSAASRVKKNDVFTVTGVNRVNPVTKEDLGVLQQFRVTADGSSDGSGNLTISIEPAIVTSGATQTVTASPADNAALTFLSGTSVVAAQGIALHKMAIATAFQPLDKPDGVDMSSTKTDRKVGVSMRFIRQYDIDTDKWKSRFDVLFGVKVIRPEWICRVASGAA